MRTLYLWFLFALAIMLWGFWPDSYGGNGPVDAIRWVHGLLAAGWMGLLVAQSWLIGHGRPRLHARFGRASRCVVPLLVASSVLVIRDMLGPHSHFDPRLRLTLAWLDFWALALFGGMYLTALRWRRHMAVHARAMAGTLFAVLPTPIGRGIGRWTESLPAALPPAYWAVDIVMIVLIARDARRGRFFWPIPIALGVTLVEQSTMFAAPDVAPFATFANWLAAR